VNRAKPRNSGRAALGYQEERRKKKRGKAERGAQINSFKDLKKERSLQILT